MKNKLLVSLLLWQTWVLGYVALLMVVHHKTLTGENSRLLAVTIVQGFIVVLLCWLLCQRLGRVSATLAAFALGLLIPVAGGWGWGLLVKGHYWQTSSVLWADFVGMGYFTSIPSALASAVVGFLQAKRSTSSPSQSQTPTH